jgi:hypothetical protein
MWSNREGAARRGASGLPFRWQYSHTLSRNIWKKQAQSADSIFTAFNLPFYPKHFHMLAGHLLS